MTATALRAAVGERWWRPQVTHAAVARTCARSQELGVVWRDRAPGGSVDLVWPARPSARR